MIGNVNENEEYLRRSLSCQQTVFQERANISPLVCNNVLDYQVIEEIFLPAE